MTNDGAVPSRQNSAFSLHYLRQLHVISTTRCHRKLFYSVRFLTAGFRQLLHLSLQSCRQRAWIMRPGIAKVSLPSSRTCVGVRNSDESCVQNLHLRGVTPVRYRGWAIHVSYACRTQKGVPRLLRNGGKLRRQVRH